MLETVLLRSRQLVHDPLGPLITPLKPSLIFRSPVRQHLTQTVEGRHRIDVLGRSLALGKIVLEFEPFNSCFDGILSGRGGRGDGRVLAVSQRTRDFQPDRFDHSRRSGSIVSVRGMPRLTWANAVKAIP